MFRFHFGNYAVEITTEKRKHDTRVTRLYITKISKIHDGMKLSEWMPYSVLDKLIKDEVHDTSITYSRQARKRLRRFNIV